ncbi:hypothetical protein Mkiyose1665_39260 [Mycobacterium kiyosense]|uniref:DUF4157 domain-containing protein n=2 Tax=Mycobacteriaceae TaxID=1762 RepID=A0A9P3V0D8_9MYCO|nr:hypothetical protein SRL2020028_06080 [Mycobacterium kiyosense]GLB90752.1 hypothetical protein SRL2020130_35690 [Mycobacterium kiyosense]GLC02264.1 hypothetical protein SRL2020400_28550 [Mycobacterium kiyosense]GLC08627.1 hypothetical protein SRL2020411_32730 [Mycobacterium kiyosense]GLC13330.1 hypothetical protein SRL2020448_19330 [Mycobacterium kiyosense]
MACALIAELATAFAMSIHPVPLRHAATDSAAARGAQTMSVAGDRAVRLIGRGGPSTDPLLSRVAADMPSAVNAVVGFWGTDWSPEITVVATDSGEQFRAAAADDPAAQRADIAAVTVAQRVDPARRTVVGARIVLAPGAAAMSAGALRIVLTHELFHYAARADTALDAPRWLTEGVADFVARPHIGVPAAALPALQSLPADAELDTGEPELSLAYDRAWWFARFVADAYGAAKLRELYLAACGVRHADLPTAVRDVLGIDTAGLLTHWQRWAAEPAR